MLLQLPDNTSGLTSVLVPTCGYSAAGEPFGACLYNGYSTTAGGLFGTAFPYCVFTQGSSRLSNKTEFFFSVLDLDQSVLAW